MQPRHAASTKPGATKTIPRPHLSPARMAAVRAQLDKECPPDTRLHTTTTQGRRSGRGVPPRSAPPNLPSTSRAQAPYPPITVSQAQSVADIPTIAFLDAAFHTYAERCASELANLRIVCTRAILKERQDREKWRSHCVTFKQERDVARERVRALIGEREAHLVRPRGAEDQNKGGNSPRGDGRAVSESSRSVPSRETTPSSTAVASDLGDDLSNYLLSYPSPTSVHLNVPPPPPTSPHKRSRSADAVLPSTSKGGFTAFDLTVTENPHGGRLIQTERVIKRRRSEDTPRTPIRQATMENGGLGECDMELESEADTPETPILKTRSTYGSPSMRPAVVEKPSAALELTHVDLMYVPTNGKLVCRVCM